MNIYIDVRTLRAFDCSYKNIIEKVILAVLDYENFPSIGEVSVSIVENEEIRGINKKYRHMDKETDVLSFPQFESLIHMENLPSEINFGDIIISYSKALEQAKEYGHSLEREIGFLTAHSMLHLLGYDHLEVEGEKIMNEKQENVLNKLMLARET